MHFYYRHASIDEGVFQGVAVVGQGAGGFLEYGIAETLIVAFYAFGPTNQGLGILAPQVLRATG